MLSVGERAFSIQFHVEMTDTTVKDWGCVPEYKSALEKTLGPDGLASFQRETDRRMPVFKRSARQLFDNLWARCAPGSARPREGHAMSDPNAIDRLRDRAPRGDAVAPNPPSAAPTRDPIEGRWTLLRPVDPASDGAALFAASHRTKDDAETLWRYMPYGPFADEASFRTWLDGAAVSKDPLFYAIVDRASGKPIGMASYGATYAFRAQGRTSPGGARSSATARRRPVAA